MKHNDNKLITKMAFPGAHEGIEHMIRNKYVTAKSDTVEQILEARTRKVKGT